MSRPKTPQSSRRKRRVSKWRLGVARVAEGVKRTISGVSLVVHSIAIFMTCDDIFNRSVADAAPLVRLARATLI
jgi:hypothetical protein